MEGFTKILTMAMFSNINLEYIKLNKYFLFYLFHSIYFNFKYLPFYQAIKLPILLYKPHFLKLKGKINIKGEIKTGMIKIGFYGVPVYPDSGCVFQISGTINFMGKAKIGNNSCILVGDKGTLTIGENFNATSSFKLICLNSINFNKNVLVGWDNLFLDFDFHKLTYIQSQMKSKGYGTIIIGENVWFSNGCRTYKNIVLPNNTVICANTILSKVNVTEENTIIGNNISLEVKKRGVFRNPNDDKIHM